MNVSSDALYEQWELLVDLIAALVTDDGDAGKRAGSDPSPLNRAMWTRLKAAEKKARLMYLALLRAETRESGESLVKGEQP